MSLAIISIVLFAACMILFCCSIGSDAFWSDEGDIFSGGVSVAKGFTLYSEFVSQHMPFSYYIAALFYLLGANSLYLFRLYFYILYSSIFVFMFIYYRNFVSKYSLCLFPLIFICLLYTYELGTSILSDQIAGLGFACLFLQLLKYNKCKKISIFDSIVISVSIVFTIGVTFVSIYGIFMIFLSFLCITIKIYKQKKNKIFIKILRDYWKFLTICILPWLILLIYLIISETLNDAVYWSYVFNRTIYSKYLLGGLGSNIFGPIKDGVNYWKIFFASCTTNFNLLYLIIVSFSTIFICYLFVKRYFLLSISSLFLIILLSNRGIFNFHVSQCVCLLSLYCSLTIFGITKKNLIIKSYLIKASCSFILSLMLLSNINFSLIKDIKYIYKQPQISQISQKVKLLTKSNEPIWGAFLAFSNLVSVEAGRPKIYEVYSVPWTWEATGMGYINNNLANLPRVLIYNPDYTVWCYNTKEYGKDFDRFVSSNYIKLDDSLYIKNSYYEEAKDILDSISKV